MSSPGGGELAALQARVWSAVLGTQEMLTVYLGSRLGLYKALSGRPSAASADLAAACGLDERYVREWLQQQAVAGFLEVVSAVPGADPVDGQNRRYRLPDATRRVLGGVQDPASLVAAGVLPLGAVGGALGALLDAFRSGAGVSDETYGDDWRAGHGAANRVVYLDRLARWLRECVPDIAEGLASPGARCLDVACGAGWASIALAAEFRDLQVDAIDIDTAIVADARTNAARSSAGARIDVRAGDVCSAGFESMYDCVLLADTLHELPRPVEVLRACRKASLPGASVVVIDAAVADQFVAPGDDIERFQFATSVLHCLPAASTGADPMRIGTVMRSSMVRDLARSAGFTDVWEFRLDDRFHMLYRLIG